MTVESRMEETLATRWEQSAAKIMQLAAELPQARWNTHPATGARSWAEVLRHIAFWNLYLAAALSGEKADDSANEIPAAEYATRDAILEALRQSFEGVGAAWKNKTAHDSKAAETLLSFLEHNAEHYGQLAVHARLNGIVPPASRG